MRKKCVLWAKPVLVTLTILIAAGVSRSGADLSAQTPDPLSLPRLAFTDFTYMGGFRLPNTSQGADFSYGGSHMAYNPARNSLFVNSLHEKVAEVTIPALVNTSDVSRMSFASYLQGFSDPSEGHWDDMGAGRQMGGLIVHGDRLYASGYVYYDATNKQVVSHFSRSTNLSEPSFRGMSQVWDTGKAGFVGGYMASIPGPWQSLLGGPVLTGQCCIPIVTRTSFGPSAFGFDPAGLGGNTALPASPLVYYTQDHQTLGPWEGSSPMYGGATLMGGAAVIAGTRTALFVGRIGAGAYCYGYGVADPALGGTRAADGQMNCYDPGNSSKGTHGYPYRYQIWAYDLADFAAVKAGAKQPWDVVPYAVWPFELPVAEKTVEIGGIAYDAQRQLLYVSQMFADRDGCCDLRPIVHALKITVPSSTAPPPLSTTVSSTPNADAPVVAPAPAPTPAPAPVPAPAPPSARVTGVVLSTNVAAPQPAASTIVWTATPTGGIGELVYKWFIYNGGSWTPVGTWTSANQFSWTPANANANYRVSAWVKRAATVADEAEASSERPFAITTAVPAPAPAATPTPAPAPVVTRVSSVALTTNVPAPQAAGSTVVWSAIATGGNTALAYKWFVYDGAQWKPVGTWTASNQFAWTPLVGNTNYRVSVWVKNAASAADEKDASTERAFAITPPRVSSVALSSSLSSPQQAPSTIVWTATPTGGGSALLYKWFVYNGSSWTAIGTWTSSNQFSWTPTIANAGYRVSAWVKNASNARDEAETSTERPFSITAPATSTVTPTPVVVPAPTSTRVSSVTLTTNVSAPQRAATTIVWTAAATGGTGELVYKWFVFDGGQWKPVGTWTSSNQLSWTPTLANANYRVSAWVKRATSTLDEAEASTERPFSITP